MFKQRAISVIILLPLAICFILFTSTQIFEIFSAIFSLWAAWEWATLSGVKTVRDKLYYLILIFALLSAGLIIAPYLLWLSAIWWIIALVILYQYTKTQSKQVVTRTSLAMGCFAIISGWVGLNTLREMGDGAGVLMLFFLLLWASDTGAYLVGSKIGRRKLAPALSPGKTIEGCLGGLVFMLPVLIGGIIILHIPASKWFGLLIVAILMNIFGVAGDLFESMLKRKIGVKDSGNVIPGHGGILDRLDSMLAAAPIFALGLLVIGIH